METMHMGWGDPVLQHKQNRLLEQHYRSLLESELNFQLCKGASSINEKVLEVIKSKQKFDKGWSFYITDEIVYKSPLMMVQNIGNCVGASHCMLIASRIAHEILAEGDPEEPLGQGMLGCPFIPYSYGVGRLAGNMLNSGDGSYCSAQMKGSQAYGYLPCFHSEISKYEGLPQASAQVGRLFGSSKSTLEKYMPSAKEFKLTETPVIDSEEQAWESLVDKYTPLQICSNWGFAYKGYDNKYGVELYQRSGSWAHSMQLVAAFEIKGSRFYAIRNQWGANYHKGSLEIGIPKGSMVVTADLVRQWIPNAEVMGIGEIVGLPANPGF